jgi:hypothetical protein
VFLLAAKSELTKTDINFLITFPKKRDLKVKYVRMVNAGENKAFQQEADKARELNLTFEFTAPCTPQQNGKIQC